MLVIACLKAPIAYLNCVIKIEKLVMLDLDIDDRSRVHA